MCPKKVFQGQNTQKKIVEFAISTTEYLFVCIFILKKHFEVSGPNLPKKGISGMKLKKSVAKYIVSTLEHPFVLTFILNKPLSSFGPNLPEKSILGTKFRKIKSPSTLFLVIVKQITKYWVIVRYSVNILGHCGSESIIMGHCGSQWLIMTHSTI